MRQNETKRKIAVTVWEHRVSPVFDSARTLLIAEIQGDAVVSTSFLTFDPDRPLELLQMLQAQKVMLLICGAVSEGPASMLEAAGLELIPFIAGDVQQVLASYLQGEPLGAEFRMPGCGKNICCRGKIRRGREIGVFANSGRRGINREQQVPLTVPKTSNDDDKGSAIATEMAVRLSAKP